MSSKRRLRRRACEQKASYPTLADAMAHKASLRHRKGEHVHAYKCDFGDHWHVGHVPWRVRQAIAAKRRAAL